MREFVPLTALLRPVRLREDLVAAPAAQTSAADPVPLADVEVEIEYAQTVGAVRRFRAALADACDAAVVRLLAEISENVLARDLALQPADVASIVAKARERLRDERIVAVRVHPSEREALSGLQLEKVADAALRPGDVVVELQYGTIDLRLRVRTQAAIAAAWQ
ncbi:MAG TPA: FliH/SctL family protein [Candidatus Cybelea sp.]|jgi:flagellar assembly protein FliH|nr:FliH/SctL family protein [Candidatus Cybelea sp.]